MEVGVHRTISQEVLGQLQSIKCVSDIFFYAESDGIVLPLLAKTHWLMYPTW